MPPLDPELSRMEPLVRMPPLTRQFVRSLEYLGPHMRLRADEASRVYLERDQNGSCWGEYSAVGPILESLPVPRRVLEIGPGLGRSVVFFTKKLGWQETEFDLYEGEGRKTRYTSMGPRFRDSFCGDFEALQRVLDFNGIQGARILDAKEYDYTLEGLPGPYDMIYSFYSVGFHWGLEHFLDEVLALMHASAIGLFTVPDDFAPFPALESSLHHRVVRWSTSFPRDGHHRMLILSKAPLLDRTE